MELEYKKAVEDMSTKIIEALNCAKQGDYLSAITIVNKILDNVTYPDLRRDAFGYRAIFLEDLGRFDEAKSDMLSSYSLVPTAPIGAATFAKSTTELRIGKICEKQSNRNEAKEWFMKALVTINDGEYCDGGSALKSFIAIVGEENLSDDEKSLCNVVASKSWKLLHIEDEPDLTNLMKTSEEIIKAKSKPRSRELDS